MLSALRLVLPGFESSRWTDDGGSGVTKIHFTSCTATSKFSSTDVIMWEDIPFLPDSDKGKKTFTACAKSGGTSKGNWPAMKNGDDVYFEIDAVNGSKGQIFLSVKTVKIAY